MVWQAYASKPDALTVIKWAKSFVEELEAYEESAAAQSPEPKLRGRSAAPAASPSPEPAVRGGRHGAAAPAAAPAPATSAATSAARRTLPVDGGGSTSSATSGASASTDPDPLPAAVRAANADTLPPHNHHDRGPEGRREILDAFSRHVMGGGGFADSELRLASAPLPQSEVRGRSRLRSIEQLPAGIAHVQRQIRTARLREVPGETPGWEDGEHDEEAGCAETASLGRERGADDAVPEPERGYEAGATGWERLKNVPSVIGWKVQVVYWDRQGRPRWHAGFVIEHMNYERINREVVHIFFTEDHADKEFSIDEPTLAFKKPKTKNPSVSSEEVRRAKSVVSGAGDDE